MKPYYQDDAVTLYHADCREILPWLDLDYYSLVTDPPYPNNAGHFDDGVEVAREVLSREFPVLDSALVFWTELEQPELTIPLVAVHIWHRTNVNGRPYEPIYHFDCDEKKRRSEVLRHAAIFDGAGPGCNEYLGHPTQKPVALMRWLVKKAAPHPIEHVVLDPFAGVGSTLRAAKDLGNRAIGIEIEERYCEIAAKRCAQEVLEMSA